MGRKRKFPKHKQTVPRWYQKEDQWGNFVFDWTFGLPTELWREIFGFLVLVVTVIILLGFVGSAGSFGEAFSRFTHKVFGDLGAFLVAASFFYLGVLLIIPQKTYRPAKFIGLFLFIIFLPSFLHLFVAQENSRVMAMEGSGGGLIGHAITAPLRAKIGLFPSFLLCFSLVVISLLMTFNFSLMEFFGYKKPSEEGEGKVNVNNGEAKAPAASMLDSMKKRFSFRRDRNSKNIMESKAEVIEVDPSSLVAKPDNTWQYPPIDILKDSEGKANSGDIHANVELIKKCLSTFGIKIAMGAVNVGPTVTQYTFKPEDGVKLNQIVARQTDLALALSAKSLRMEAPIPGKNSVGLELPNKVPAKVTLKEVLKSAKFKTVKSRLAIALGRDVSGDQIAIDLEKMPHLLIAGSTGSGKSVCINSTICSLLFHNSPKDLRLLLVDPKRVELTGYNGIPHLLTTVVTEVDKTVSSLKWAVCEMERRYQLFSELGKRNIVAYNSDPGPEGKLPYIVIIIDELADLMATSAKEVESSIVRLAQMARATGIHLVIATQRPSVDVLTGLIKANITSRVAFATASQVDSRTILDLSGAEKLLGNGDMLFLGNGLNKPKRLQGCFVSDSEIEELTEFLRSKGVAEYDESIQNFRTNRGDGSLGGEGSDEDDLYNEAVETIIRAGKASASLLQRRLRVGYARAARLLDILEQKGVIGPAEGSKPRDVLVGGGQFGGVPGSFQQEDNYNDQYMEKR